MSNAKMDTKSKLINSKSLFLNFNLNDDLLQAQKNSKF